MTVSYPRLAARTLRFTLGVPRHVTVSPDGATMRFVRTPDGVTRTGQLWEHDVATGTESLLVDPAALLDGEEELSAAERSRRERARESAAGIVSYDVDATGRWACFALSGGLWAAHLGARSVKALPSTEGVIDPRLDPTGRRIAYAAGGALRVIGVDGADDRALVEPDTDTVVWGQADFIAAEELDRFRGFCGHRTARRCWCSAPTRRRCRPGTWPTRSTPTVSRSPSGTPRRARPTPTSRCGC